MKDTIRFTVKFNRSSTIIARALTLSEVVKDLDVRVVNSCPGWAFCVSTVPGSTTSCEITW
jgi:hypothetical protein